MPISFGQHKSNADFIDPAIGPRGVRFDRRQPFTLDGELTVIGGKGGREIAVQLHIAGKTNDAVLGQVNGWIAQEGQFGPLTLTPKPGGTGVALQFAECYLERVIPGQFRPVAWDSDLKQGGYIAEPILVFRQVNVPNQSAAAASGFGA